MLLHLLLPFCSLGGHFHSVRRSVPHKSVPQAGELCWHGTRGPPAVSPPRCLLGKVLPKIQPPPSFRPIPRCTRHLLNCSLECLFLEGWGMQLWPVSGNLQMCSNKQDGSVVASELFITDKDSLCSPSLNAFCNLSKNCYRRVVIAFCE